MIIDSHLHVWQRSPGSYRWLVPEFGPLCDDFPPQRAQEELRLAGVEGAILVQADDTRADSRYMFDAAQHFPWVSGVVAWVPLDRPDEAAEMLGAYLDSEVFCGIRQLVHDDPRDHVYRLESVSQTAQLLASHGVPLDIPDAWPRDLPQVVELARKHPDLTLVLDHMGKPPVEREQLERWSGEISALAEQGNTVVKFSGLHHPERAFTPEAVEHLWELGLELFGPERIMVGSDWPITVTSGGYQPTWETISHFVGSLSDDERSAVSWRTATRVYGHSRRLTRLTSSGDD